MHDSHIFMTHLHTKFHKSRPTIQTIKFGGGESPSHLRVIIHSKQKYVNKICISGPYTKCSSQFINSDARHIVITDAGNPKARSLNGLQCHNYNYMFREYRSNDTHIQAAWRPHALTFSSSRTEIRLTLLRLLVNSRDANWLQVT